MTCCPVRSLCWAFTGAKNLRKVLAAHEVNPLLANSLQGQHQGLLPRPQVLSEKGSAHRHLLKTETPCIITSWFIWLLLLQWNLRLEPQTRSSTMSSDDQAKIGKQLGLILNF